MDTSEPQEETPSPRARCLWTAAGLEGAADLALLGDGRVAAALPGRDTVLLYSPAGDLEGPLQPGSAFSGTGSVASLADGRLAVLNSLGVQLFMGDGAFLRAFPLRGLGATGGLCQDRDGVLAIINRCQGYFQASLIKFFRRTDQMKK